MNPFEDRIFALWSLRGRGPYILLILSSLAIFIVPLLNHAGIFPEAIVQISFIIVLVSGVFIIPSTLFLKISTVVFASLAVATHIFHHIDPKDRWMEIADNLFAILTLLVFVLLMMHRFLTNRSTLINRIAIAVTLYLLFGLMWAKVYQIIFLLDSSAFTIEHRMTPFTFIYFSFVTLLTIGYGDIVPISVYARSFAILEGVIGQLYMVIMISSLVSEFATITVKNAIEEDEKK